MNLFERLKPKTEGRGTRCDTCGGPLVRNNPGQSLRFCRDGCRYLRPKGRKAR